MIFTQNNSDNKLEIEIKRFDMAINFFCCIKKAGKYFLVAYYYNPKWNLFFPFYDDVNKTPILQKAKAKTCKELICETDKILNVDLKEKLQKAKQRFKELVGCDCEVQKSDLPDMFEIKHSKTANLHTIYKLFNFIVTKVGDVDCLLNPKKLQCKLFDLDNLENCNDLVENAIWFCKRQKNQLKKFAIEID